ncbi:MAG: hypothetical protein ACK4F8_09845 [Aquabacterium sp.]
MSTFLHLLGPWAIRIAIATVLAVVFLMYFQAELVMDLANLLWRCA